MKEEPFQCDDSQEFYKEHHRLIREFLNFKIEQEFNWASFQFFWTLCSTVNEESQNQLSDKDNKDKSVENSKHIFVIEITYVIEELENVNAYLYSMEAWMERI